MAEILALSDILECPVSHLLLPADPEVTIDFPSGLSMSRGKWSAEAGNDPLVREAVGQLKEELDSLVIEMNRHSPEGKWKTLLKLGENEAEQTRSDS